MNNTKIDKSVTVSNETRLCFVNPNAVNGTINGVPLTPPYEDMCISVNLEIEVVARTKTDNTGTNGAEFNNNVYVMSWATNYNVDENGKFNGSIKGYEPIYFMQGRDAQEYLDGLTKEKYLTTYYTDISLDDIRNRNIIEGLGITSIDIAYDNMYMPTITINFVDVRGSSLFGREEEVHTGNSITSETIFGCFFTLPYPKFRLHVKGFFGDAVTYQLACTGFKGKFNSQTGNFEITTTFIGYQYSLLTDIPFVYLIAAPYCEYIGEKYWDKHIKTGEWKLSDNGQMMKLYEMYKELKKELKDGLPGATSLASVDLSNTDIAIKQLKGIWDEVKTGIKEQCTYFGYTKEDEGYLDETSHETFYLCLTGTEEKIIYNKDVAHKLNNLQEEINKYNAKFTDKPIKFAINENFKTENQNKSQKYIDYKVDKSKSVTLKQTDVKYNEALKSFITTKVSEAKNNKKYEFVEKHQYGYVFSDGGFEYSTSNANEILNNEKKEEEAKVKEEAKNVVSKEVMNALKFKPSIGNFFKIIIAHLETFTAMMYGCATTILKQMKNGEREPSKLNVHFDQTDVVPTQNFIPPFPAIFKRDINKAEADIKNGVFKALGWVGDFSPNFEEEKLVVAIYNAAQRIVASTDKLASGTRIDVSKVFPSMPFDWYTSNVMNNIGGFTTDMFAALLGVRMSQIFGILNNGKLTANDKELAKAHGKMDALNLFQAVLKKEDIRYALFNERKPEESKPEDSVSNYTNKKDVVYNIMRCVQNNEAETYAKHNKHNDIQGYEFEYYSYGDGTPPNYIYDNNPRTMHPVIVDGLKTNNQPNENKTTYTYVWGGKDTSEFGIIPVSLTTPSSVFGISIKNSGGKSSIHNINLNSIEITETSDVLGYNMNNEVIYNTSSKELFNNTDAYKNYMNNSMFFVITDQITVKDICDRCELLKKDDIKIDGYDGKISNVKIIIDRYCDLNVNQYINTNVKNYLAQKKTDTLSLSDIQKDKINTEEKQYEITAGETKSSIDSKLTFIDAEKAFSTTDFNDYFVPYCLCNCGGKTHSLEITTAFLNNYDDIEDRDFVLAMKCWWLIQTVPLNWSKTSEILKPKNNHGCMRKVPLAMVLLLGGAIYLSKKAVKDTSNNKEHFQNMKFTFDKGSSDNPSAINSIESLIKSGIHKTFISNNKLTLHSSNTLTLQQIFGGVSHTNWRPDNVIANKLEEIFVTWMNDKGKSIIDGMSIAPNISWAAYKSILTDMQNLYNKETSSYNDNADEHVSIAWGSGDGSVKPDTPLVKTLTNRGSNYCNYFNSSWSGTPFNLWSGQWKDILHKTETINTTPADIVKLFSGRGLPNSNWCEGDEHWLAVCNDSELIAYWKSNVSFRLELIELYTGSCMVFINTPHLQMNYNQNTDV